MKLLNYLSMRSLVLVVTIFAFSCENLDTENPNNPPQSKVLSTGSDLEAFLAGGFLSWWKANHTERPAMALMVGGDAVSCSWGNYAMQRWGTEPRETLNNSSSESADYINVLNHPYYNNHKAQFTANAVIKAITIDGISSGSDDTDTMLLSSAYFLRGIARGYLGLVFDQAFITDETTDLVTVADEEPVDYKALIAAALTDLDKVIEETQSYDLSNNFFNGLTDKDQDWLKALASSYAARFLAQSPRTVTENVAVNWASVKTYAANGITENFAPIADGTHWWSYQWASTATKGGSWARVDMRIMHLMDNNQPKRYPEDGTAPPATVSSDNRLATDFTKVNNSFSASRGVYFYGTHQHDRSDDPTYIGVPDAQGPLPVFVVEDNQMLLAEANLRLGSPDLAAAAAILNNPSNSRIARGGLPTVAVNVKDIEDAIIYERFVEILNTGPGGQFFDRRRLALRADPITLDTEGLQKGTPAQLPMPAKELELLGRDVYTFGGSSDDEGLGS